MSKYNINFNGVTESILWFYLRTTRLLSFLYSLIKALKTMHNDGVLVEAMGQDSVTFYQLVRYIQNFINFDARTLYLQKYLNDIYDPISARIVIVNDNTSHVLYLFNLVETTTAVYFYNNWDSTIAYVIDDYIVSANKVYVAIGNNTNDVPPSANWTEDSDITYMYSYSDQFPADYRIDIPLSVTAQPDYSHDRIKSQINLLNSAGRTYNGVELGNTTNVFFTNIE